MIFKGLEEKGRILKDDVWVLDDVIPLHYQDFLEKIIYISEEFGLCPLTSDIEENLFHPNTLKNIKDNPQLVFRDQKPNIHNLQSYFHIPLFMGLSKIGMTTRMCDLKRMKVNLQLQGDHTNKDKYNVPHIDFGAYSGRTHYTSIYYINNSDGDTYIFNEKFHDKKENIELTIKKKIPPKKGRLIIFRGDSFHAGSTPTQSKFRMVCNYNFIPTYLNELENDTFPQHPLEL